MPAAPPPFSRPGSPRSPQGNPPGSGQAALGGGGLTVVGIGASAGGLEACIKLFEALPADSGMCFILIQHLDPTHRSMMVELLAEHTRMTVCQAANGMRLESDHLYVIPPGTYLSVHEGALLLSPPQARHGARLPFDFLLHTMAEEIGARAICVVLSGTGADGSLGLKAVKERCGLVIAQDPDEAGYDGMPRSAIATGAVDLVLPVAQIPDALLRYHRRMAATGSGADPAASGARDWLPAIIEFLRARTGHDFTSYKPGTLHRRIERRMAIAAIETDDMNRYLDLLSGDPAERDRLAKDLLINVTSFFRDPAVFGLLEKQIIPDMIARHPPDQPLRIWIVGCSTGQEAYSLAMLFYEQLTAQHSGVKLQVFASDVDAEAIASAREGLYPDSIEAELSPERLARFCVKREDGYRIVPELRGLIVFTVHDVLTDPPFSRLDLVSCRNLLIYLRVPAQERVISLFQFALREGGILLLGSAETVGNASGGFDPVAKSERVFRHVGRARPPSPLGAPAPGTGLKVRAPPGQASATIRQSTLAELGRRLVLDCFAPAAVLINRDHDCLYTLGPTDRYLRVPVGPHSNDLLAMARPGLRAKLKAAIEKADLEKTRIVLGGGRMRHGGGVITFNIDVQPVQNGGEDLLLVCFVDQPAASEPQAVPERAGQNPQVAVLEQELEATRTELRATLRDLERSGEEQNAINEEALSVNEEFQSTNEELLTSKEELQSLNEELTALNSQLQETLERQRTTASDLQNVLFSTDVATLFLDPALRIRFFTPASKALFNIIPGDIGRPLADLNSLASDTALTADARAVLEHFVPISREIEVPGGVWFTRRILPYRGHDDRVEGVVITFSNTSESRRAAKALEVARQQAELANLAKTRFLAAASHDLRQPLQTLALLQGLLAKAVEGERPRQLTRRLGDTLAAMAGILNTLLDVNQIEAGVIKPHVVGFPINELLIRLNEEFGYLAQAQGLVLRVVPCSLMVESDPRLLGQMARNLLTNALKYTTSGGVLLGCRRRGGRVGIEVWDTGIGIQADQLDRIFGEYHQLDNATQDRSRGLGLGLAIVEAEQTAGPRGACPLASRQGFGVLDRGAAPPGRAGAGSGAITRPPRRGSRARAAHRRDPDRRG